MRHLICILLFCLEAALCSAKPHGGGACYTPVLSPAPGAFGGTQTVTITDSTVGAVLHFTVDGTIPTATSPTYTVPISVSSTTTVKAIATAPRYSLSKVAGGTYTITLPSAAVPTFSPAAGTYSATQTVTISDSTAGAIIHYTTDGSTPTVTSPAYTTPLSVSATSTVQAIAAAAGYAPSAVGSAQYVISSGSATLLFESNFSSATAFSSTPAYCGSTECYQLMSGTDASTGFTWPPCLWGSCSGPNYGGFAVFSQTYGPNAYLYQTSGIETVTGPLGTSISAIRFSNKCATIQQVYSGQLCVGSGTSAHLTGDGSMGLGFPDTNATQTDVYVRYWLLLQSDLAATLIPGQFPDLTWGNWRAITEWKTGTSSNHSSTPCVPTSVSGNNYGGDLRIITDVIKPATGSLFWRSYMDTNANGGLPATNFWTIDNHTVAVPAGTWAKVEYYLHRASDSTGRSVLNINGANVYDYKGWTINLPTSQGGHGGYGCAVSRIAYSEVYTTGLPNAPSGAYQHVADLQIWNGLPSDSTIH